MLIISADLKPRYIVNQIILQAISSNEHIIIFLVSNLNNLLQELVKFSCYAFVILDDGIEQLPELYSWSKEISIKYHPIPELIDSYFKQRKRSLISKEDSKCTTEPSCHSETKDVNVNSLYLTKEDSQRGFIPNNAINLKPSTLRVGSIKRIKADFISLDLQENDKIQFATASHPVRKKKHFKKEKKSQASLKLYQPLIIHKVQNSSNKIKKKRNKKKKNI